MSQTRKLLSSLTDRRYFPPGCQDSPIQKCFYFRLKKYLYKKYINLTQFLAILYNFFYNFFNVRKREKIKEKRKKLVLIFYQKYRFQYFHIYIHKFSQIKCNSKFKWRLSLNNFHTTVQIKLLVYLWPNCRVLKGWTGRARCSRPTPWSSCHATRSPGTARYAMHWKKQFSGTVRYVTH